MKTSTMPAVAKRSSRKVKTQPPEVPLLVNGDRLTQAEFHHRYEAYPEDVKFELIGGVVYRASPLRWLHGSYHLNLGTALNFYAVHTPGVVAGVIATAILGEESEPQPDLTLRLLEAYGGLSRLNAKSYVVGPAELLAEIAHSNVALAMHQKHDDYERAGVREYVVLCVDEQQVHWFQFPSGRRLKPDARGIFRSRVFPGLWIDGPGLLARDSVRLIRTVQQGLDSPEHERFRRRLQAIKRP